MASTRDTVIAKMINKFLSDFGLDDAPDVPAEQIESKVWVAVLFIFVCGACFGMCL